MNRIRKTISVQCKKCTISYEKRVDTMKNWSGYCKECVNKVITTKGKYRTRKPCIDCGKYDLYNTSKRCKDCFTAPKGNNHYNWKGGTSSMRHLAMGRQKYKEWREKVFEKDDYTCQICGQYSGTLHADHIEPWSISEEKRYDVNNGRTLCVPCHYYITFKKQMPVGSLWCNFKLIRKRG